LKAINNTQTTSEQLQEELSRSPESGFFVPENGKKIPSEAKSLT